MSKHFRVLTFDNRGTGRSARVGWRYRMQDLADDAAAVIEASGAQSAHVFGNSMGGMIALELALRHPERVRSLALGCTYACWRTAQKPSQRTLLDLLLLNLGLTSRARLGQLLFSAEWQAKNPSGALEWISRAGPTSARFAVAQMLAVRGHSCEERLSQIRASTLVLTGDAARLIPAANSEILARAIRGARLLTLQGAGHAFPLEREEDTVRALTEHFLAFESRAA
jgi:pimeloyl-ACP methyl ester carboxylesterase